jgi:hypothetical protein
MLRTRDEFLERFQSFVTDVMLDPLRIVSSRMSADAKRDEQALDDTVLFPCLLRDRLAGRSEENAAIGPQRHKTILGQPLQHLGDRRLCDPKPRRNVDLAGFAAVGDEVGDKLDVIGRQRRAARGPRMPEARDVLLHFQEGLTVLAGHPGKIPLAVEIA